MKYDDDPTRYVPYGSRECALCGSECYGHTCEQCWTDDARRWHVSDDTRTRAGRPFVDDYPDWRSLI